MLDWICPYCINRFSFEPYEGALCNQCRGKVSLMQTRTAFVRLITDLQRYLFDQCWPDYLTRSQCVRILRAFQYSDEALTMEFNLGARHSTEAVLMLLGGGARSRGLHSRPKRAIHQLERMAGRMGYAFPNDLAHTIVFADVCKLHAS